MAKKSVTIDGMKYGSRTEAAKALVANGKSIAEAAAAAGLTYPTVYANTKGAEMVNKRRVKYQVLALGKGGNRTSGEIAQRTGLSTSAVVAMLKKAGIAIVTKESKATTKKTAGVNATKAPESLKTPKTPKNPKTSKAPKAPKVIDDISLDDTTEFSMDDMAMAAAMADMDNK